MKLWCEVHRTNHAMPPSHVEQLVYVLQAMAADEQTLDKVPGHDQPRLVCLLDVMLRGGDSEGYLEHVEALRARRLHAERSKRPQLRRTKAAPAPRRKPELVLLRPEGGTP